jgi:hypothetical protein
MTSKIYWCQKIMLRSSRTLLTVLIAVAFCGVGLLLFHTRHGPGITGDSVSYVMGAENVILGRGYSRTAGGGEAVPITGFPPGYTTALVLFSWISRDFFSVGRILNALLFGLNIFLSGFILWKFTRSTATALIGSLFLLLSEDLIHAHAWVMSEGLFLTLSLLGIFSFVNYFGSSRKAHFVTGALLFSAATLTRYVGIALICAAGLFVLIASNKALRKRIQDLLILGVISCIPVVMWLLRNASLEGTATNRELGFHPPSWELIRTFLGSVNAWVFPFRLGLPDWIRAPISVIVLVIIPLFIFYRMILRKDYLSDEGEKTGLEFLPTYLLLYIPFYSVVLIANTTFLDAGTSTAGAARYLTPIFPIVVLFVLSLSYRYIIWKAIPQLVRTTAILLATLILGMYAGRAYQFVSNPGEMFRYTDMKRRMPHVVEALIDLDQERILISNDIQLTYVLSDRPAYLFPLRFDVYRLKEREDYNEQVDVTKERLEEGAVLVMFEPLREEQENTMDLLDVVPLYSFSEATIYVSE